MTSIVCNIQKLFSLRSKKSQENEDVSFGASKLDNVLMEIQKILVWDDPFRSCCAIIFLNIAFWSIIYLDLKLYGIVFMTILILKCEQLWVEILSKYFKSNLENDFHCSSITTHKNSHSSITRSGKINMLFKECSVLIKKFFDLAKSLKQTQPGIFCILTSLIFLLLAVIGRYFSGVVACYILLMLILTVPGGVIHFLPLQIIKNLSELIYSSQKDSFKHIDYEDESFLPESSEEVLEVLRLAGDSQTVNNDEDSNDLLLEQISEIASDTTEFISSKFPIFPEPVNISSPEQSFDMWGFDLPAKNESAIINPEITGINFQNQHFDGESSEEEFVRGLDLSNKTIKRSKKNKTHPNGSELINESLKFTSKNSYPNEFESISITASGKESSSETDSFEMISENDI